MSSPLERGAGIYLPVWAVGPTTIERNLFERNNGADLDCDAAVSGVFRDNVIRDGNGPAGMVLYQCHRWVVERNTISLPSSVRGFDGPWCFPSTPGRRAAAIMGCVTQDLRIVDNVLSSYYALALHHDTRLVVSGNETTGLVSIGSWPDSSLRNASIVSASVPSWVRRGSTFTVRVTFRNTGHTSWQPGWYRLGDPADGGTLWGQHRFELPGPGSVVPGQSAEFTVALRAPSRAGYATLRLRMLEETVVWFGSTLTRSIRIAW